MHRTVVLYHGGVIFLLDFIREKPDGYFNILLFLHWVVEVVLLNIKITISGSFVGIRYDTVNEYLSIQERYRGG